MSNAKFIKIDSCRTCRITMRFMGKDQTYIDCPLPFDQLHAYEEGSKRNEIHPDCPLPGLPDISIKEFERIIQNRQGEAPTSSVVDVTLTLAGIREQLAQLEKYGALDHDRLARIESMLMFTLDKQGVETLRRPTGQDKIEGATPHTRVRVFRSYYEEWLEGWEAKEKARKIEVTEADKEEASHEQTEEKTKGDSGEPGSGGPGA